MPTNEDLKKSVYMQEELNEFLQQHELNKLAETLQQTDKFKKVGVNSIAISKIPYVKYPGISIEDCVTIHDLAQEVLYLSMTENNNNEVAITFSLDHEELKKQGRAYKAIAKGNEVETDLGADTDTYHLLQTSQNNVLVSLHNHPSSATFSIFDIGVFIRNATIGYMIVVTNKGELYYMRKDKNRYNAIAASECFVNSIKKIKAEAYDGKRIDLSILTNDEMLKISEEFLYSALKSGIHYVHAIKNELMISQYDIEQKKQAKMEECSHEWTR